MMEQLRRLDGSPLEDSEGQAITVQSVCEQALVAQVPGENPEGQEKFRRYALAMRIRTQEGMPDLQAKDVVLLKELVGVMFGPLVVGQVWAILDPPAADA
jgi:hypothetical protein